MPLVLPKPLQGSYLEEQLKPAAPIVPPTPAPMSSEWEQFDAQQAQQGAPDMGASVDWSQPQEQYNYQPTQPAQAPMPQIGASMGATMGQEFNAPIPEPQPQRVSIATLQEQLLNVVEPGLRTYIWDRYSRTFASSGEEYALVEWEKLMQAYSYLPTLRKNRDHAYGDPKKHGPNDTELFRVALKYVDEGVPPTGHYDNAREEQGLKASAETVMLQGLAIPPVGGVVAGAASKLGVPGLGFSGRLLGGALGAGDTPLINIASNLAGTAGSEIGADLAGDNRLAQQAAGLGGGLVLGGGTMFGVRALPGGRDVTAGMNAIRAADDDMDPDVAELIGLRRSSPGEDSLKALNDELDAIDSELKRTFDYDTTQKLQARKDAIEKELNNVARMQNTIHRASDPNADLGNARLSDVDEDTTALRQALERGESYTFEDGPTVVMRSDSEGNYYALSGLGAGSQTFDSIDEVLKWADGSGLVGPPLPGAARTGFRDADTAILQDQYARMSKEQLEDAIRGSDESFAKLDQMALEGNWDDAKLRRREMTIWNQRKQAQAWLDVRNGRKTADTEQLMQTLLHSNQWKPGEFGALFGPKWLTGASTKAKELLLKNLKNAKATGGGFLFNDAPNLRPLTQVMDEVVTADPGIAGRFQAVVGRMGINPALNRKTPAGVAATASMRQQIQSEGLRDLLVRTGWDIGAAKSPLGNRHFKIDTSGELKVTNASGTSETVPWQKVFERPQDYKLTLDQEIAVYRYNEVVEAVERMRELNGLPNRRMKLPPDQNYVPRQAVSLRGVEVPRRARHGVSRAFEHIEDARAREIVYADPRTTLADYIDEAYREVRNTEFDNYMSRYAITPAERVPEPIQIEFEKTRKAYLQAWVVARKEGRKAQKAYEQLVTKDVNTAETQYHAARRSLIRIEGELTGRGTLVAGRKQSPISYGRRLADARAIVNVTEQIYKDAKEAFALRAQGKSGQRRLMDSVPEPVRTDFYAKKEALGKANAQAKANGLLPSQYKTDPGVVQARADYSKSKQAYDDAVRQAGEADAATKGQAKQLLSKATTTELDKLKAAYDKASSARKTWIEKSDLEGLGNMGFWSNASVKARGTMQEAKRELRKAQLEARRAGVSYHKDPAVIAARANYNSANQNYTSVLRSEKGKYIDDPNLRISEWKNKFMPEEYVKDLEKGLSFLQDKDENPITQAMQEVADIRRIPTTGLDFGTPFIHGLPMLARNPVIWAKSVVQQYRNFADPAVQTKFMDDHAETITWLAQHELMPGGSDFFDALKPSENKPLTNMIGKVMPSGVKNANRAVTTQTLGRFAAAHESHLMASRVLYAEALRPGWKGTDAELAAHVRNLTGGLDSRALGVQAKQRAIESAWVALSPRLLRSVLGLATEAMNVRELRELGPSTLLGGSRGGEARRALIQLTAATTGLYWAAGEALGIPEEERFAGLNPLNGKRFLSYKINGQWIGVGGTIRATTQLIAGVTSALAPGGKPIGHLWSLQGRENPLLQYIISRGAPLAGIATVVGEGLTGANLTGFEQVDGVADMFLQLGKDNLPFTVIGAMEGDSLLGSAAGNQGLRTSPETPVEERMEEIEDNIIPILVNRGVLPKGITSTDELGFGEADAVERYLKNTDPKLHEAYQAYRREFGSTYQRMQDRRKEIEMEAKPKFDNLYADLVTGKQDPRAIVTQLSALRSELRGQFKELYTDKEFQKAVGKLEANQMQQLAEDYFNLFDKVVPSDRVVQPEDWDKIEVLQKEFLAALPANQRERFEKDLKLRDSVFDAHPIIKLKREVDEASKDYNELGSDSLKEAYLAENPDLDISRSIMYGSSLHSAQAVDAMLQGFAEGETLKALSAPAFAQKIQLAGYAHRIDTDITAWNRDKNILVNIKNLDATDRAKVIEGAPQINAALFYWGGTSRLYKPEAAVALATYMQSSGWEYWQAYGGRISTFHQLPLSNKDKLDQKHVQAMVPEMDAVLNLFREFMYGESPEFYTIEGRTAFYNITGRNVEQYPIVPLEE